MKNNEKKNNKLNLKIKKKQNKTFLLSRVLKNIKQNKKRKITSTRLDKILRENKRSNFIRRLFIEVQQIQRNCNKYISQTHLFIYLFYMKTFFHFNLFIY